MGEGGQQAGRGRFTQKFFNTETLSYGRGCAAARERSSFMKEDGLIRNQMVSSDKVEFSKKLRSNMTEAEKVFWELVRAGRLNSLKFRRQQIIDGFIVDFYCHSLGLCVEIDGGVHNTEEQKEYDRQRDEVLELRNLKVLRFTNDDVFNNVEEIIKAIKNSRGK